MVSYWKYRPIQKGVCTVEEVICDHQSTDDPTGPLNGRHAVLTGSLTPVQLVVLDEESAHVWRSRRYAFNVNSLPVPEPIALIRAENLRSYDAFLDVRIETSLRREDVGRNCWLRGRCGKKCCVWTQDEARFYCFQLFTMEPDEEQLSLNGPGMLSQMWYLVLRSSPTTKGAFERIGIGFWEPAKGGGNGTKCHLFRACETTTIKIV